MLLGLALTSALGEAPPPPETARKSRRCKKDDPGE